MNKEKSILLKVADFGFLVKWTHPPMAEFADNRYRGFIHYDKINSITSQLNKVSYINVYCNKPKNKALFTNSTHKVISVPKLWTLYKNETDYYLKMFDGVKNRLIGIAKISGDFKNTDYYFLGPDYKGTRIDKKDTKDYWLLQRVVHPLVKSLLVNFLAKYGGCLIHGAGIKINNLGIAFVGKSESGKSTLAGFFRLHKDVTVLTDETLAITRKDGGFYIQGTPWPGGAGLANSAKAPLKNIFFISHGKQNVIKPVSPQATFKKLISQAILGTWDSSLINSMVSFIKDLSKEITFFDLEFVKDESVVSFIRKERKI